MADHPSPDSRAVERATWPDPERAIDLHLAGVGIDFYLAVARYLTVPGGSGAALDVCCGSGQGAVILQRRGYHPVHAFDRFDGARRFLESRGVTFTACDFRGYKAPTLFMLVTACDCLEHLPDPAGALLRIRDWLAPDGRLFLAVPLENEVGRNRFHINAWDRAGLLKLLAVTEWTIERETNDFDAQQHRFWGLLK